MKIFLNKEYNVNNIKIKKILKSLNVVTLNQILLKTHETMNNACQWKTWIELFCQKNKKKFQKIDVNCSFLNSHEIEYSYVNLNHVNCFQFNHNTNLIIVSSMIIFNWTKHMTCFMTKKFVFECLNVLSWLYCENFDRVHVKNWH